MSLGKKIKKEIYKERKEEKWRHKMEKNLTPKEQRLLRYLRDHKKGIASLEAIKNLGDTRLSATIYLLRNRGYCILGEKEESVNRYGEITRFNRYILVGE